MKEDLNTAYWVYNSKLRDIDRTIRWLSMRHILKDAFRNKKISPVRDEFMRLKLEEKLESSEKVHNRLRR